MTIPTPPLPFDILSRHQKIHQHTVLEASAGTGKTFAIENLIVRLLIEEPLDTSSPLLLEKILVVTFTRSATRDLQLRILENLNKTISLLKQFLTDFTISFNAPDYIVNILEQGESAARPALRRLEHALFTYDQAQIFTIHGFCHKSLSAYSIEGGMGLSAISQEEESSVTTRLIGAIRNFLRTELKPTHYSSFQLDKILAYATSGKRDIKLLEEKLLKEINRGLQFPKLPTFDELFIQFEQTMKNFIKNHHCTRELFIASFYAIESFYTGVRKRDKQIHSHILNECIQLASLFEKKEWDKTDLHTLLKYGTSFFDRFNDDKMTKKAALEPIKKPYTSLIYTLKEAFSSIFLEGANPPTLFLRLVKDCQSFLENYQMEEELFGHHDLLVKMKEATKSLAFSNEVRNAYQAVIIDEFQDTDPIQWEIFSSLFITDSSWKGILYIIGDPKQSIYAFRQADIYTYIKAAKSLGENALWTLDTNFRSQASLVKALNLLFSSASGLFPLPKIDQELSYRQVFSGNNSTKEFVDEEACIHFWTAQNEDALLSAIGTEILKLASSSIFPSQCAVLTADRYQADRLVAYLQNLGIPVKSQRSLGLEKSSALEAMKAILNGIFHYKDFSAFKLALSHPVIGGIKSHELNQSSLSPLLALAERLRLIWISEGFSLFYDALMKSTWNTSKTILEQMLESIEADNFYSAWQDIADVLIREEMNQMLSPQSLIDFLSKFETLANNDDSSVKRFQNREEEGVSILTTHASKGLEFDIVFALGMIKRSKGEEAFIPVQNCLKATSNEEDPDYLNFSKEMDAEKMRQLYVAFTRAKYRLYIPVLLPTEEQKTKKLNFGQASPIELFLARFGAEADYPGLYKNIHTQNETMLCEFINQHKETKFFSIKHLKENKKDTVVLPNFSKKIFPELLVPKQLSINTPKITVESFSSLAKNINLETAVSRIKGELLIKAPYSFTEEVKTIHTLPAGEKTGLQLHYILEKIHFYTINENIENAALQIRPFIKNTLFETWEKVIAEMIIKALKTPLPGTTSSFCLADVNPKKIYRETEFFYKNKNNDSFLKGVIDLLFEHEDKYYIVDWKSNWLGPDDSYYTKESIEKAILSNQYDLQAAIYKEGMRRYLNLFNKGPFEKIFGGVYYIFLRGADQKGTDHLHLENSHEKSEKYF